MKHRSDDDIREHGRHRQDDSPANHEFDQAMRQRYHEALTKVPTSTRARLRAARDTAAQQAPPQAGGAWQFAGAGAAVFALVLGLQFFNAPAPVESTSADQTIAAPEAAFDADSAVAALDENPDLYLWLAVNDDALPPFPEP